MLSRIANRYNLRRPCHLMKTQLKADAVHSKKPILGSIMTHYWNKMISCSWIDPSEHEYKNIDTILIKG